MTSAHRPIFSLNPASWPIPAQAVAVVLAVSLAPMLFTAYYNSSSREALRDIDLRSQRQVADNVVARQIGASARYSHTVIGDAVDVAARLDALTRDVGQHILINHASCAGLRNHPEIVSISPPERKLNGCTGPVNVYAIAGVQAVIAPDVAPPPDAVRPVVT